MKRILFNLLFTLVFCCLLGACSKSKAQTTSKSKSKTPKQGKVISNTNTSANTQTSQKGKVVNYGTNTSPQASTQTTMPTPPTSPTMITKEPILLISTSKGDIKVKLYNETPQHRDNFLKLAKEAYFDGTLFHRVIKEFMIQGGDPGSKGALAGKRLGTGGPGYTVPAEFIDKYCHKKGALSAARKGDQVNPKRASSGSQFYIVQGKTYTESELASMEKMAGFTFTAEQKEAYKTIGGTPFLDKQYTVFGEVIEGLEIIDLIANCQTGAGDRPIQDVKMTVKVLSE